MGNTGIGFKDIYSAFSNQAGLAYLPAFSAAIAAEQRFLVSDIQSFSAAAALPTSSGTFGLTLNYYGFEDFNEQRVGLAYARKLFDKLSIGAQFLYLGTRIPEYGNKASFTFEAGLLMEIIKGLSLGVHVYSPARISLLEDENLPTRLGLGLVYQPSSKVLINVEVEKDIDYKIRLKSGVEYQIVDPLYLRVGVATEPTLVSFGLGVQLKNSVYIDFASSYHQVLGFTPAVGISYRGKSK